MEVLNKFQAGGKGAKIYLQCEQAYYAEIVTGIGTISHETFMLVADVVTHYRRKGLEVTIVIEGDQTPTYYNIVIMDIQTFAAHAAHITKRHRSAHMLPENSDGK